jgi:hypothetical protein
MYHAKYTQQWMHSHPEVMEARRKVVMAKYYGKFPIMAKFCEVCPTDEQREATATHHPDYNYPNLIVSCCDTCHVYLNKQRQDGASAGRL